MQIVGNVIGGPVGRGDFGTIFNVVGDVSEAVPGVPVLHVGMGAAAGRRPSEGGEGDEWWTFSKMESRSEYERDVEAFRRMCVGSFLSGIRYSYVDFPSFGYTRLKSLLAYFGSESRKYVHISGNGGFMYVYPDMSGRVFGVSLSMLDYVGVSRTHAVRKIGGMVRADSRAVEASGIMDLSGGGEHLVPVLFSMIER